MKHWIATALAGVMFMGAAAAQQFPEHPRIELTPEQRDAVTRHITRGPMTSEPEDGVPDLRPGVEVPRNTRLYPIPHNVAEQVPPVRGFRYFVAQNSMVLVDPGDNRIVQVVPIR